MRKNITTTFADRDFRKAKASNILGLCVEVAMKDGQVAVRDSKDKASVQLQFSAAEWAAFVDGVKNGEFDAV